MVKVAVVIPTVTGREDSLLDTVRALDHPSVDFIVQKDSGGCGHGWVKGLAVAMNDPDWQYVMLHTDDMIAHPGAIDAAIRCCKEGWWPMPTVEETDGTLRDDVNNPVRGFSIIPFMDRELAERIAPQIPMIHYYVDIAIADLVRNDNRKRGFLSKGWQLSEGYRFTHHWHPVKRSQEGYGPDKERYERWGEDYLAFTMADTLRGEESP